MAKHIPTVFFHDLPQQQCGEVFWYWSDPVDCIFCAIFPRFWKANISQHQMMEQRESLPSWAQEAYRGVAALALVSEGRYPVLSLKGGRGIPAILARGGTPVLSTS